MQEQIITIEQLKTDRNAQEVVRKLDILRPERNTTPHSHTSGNGAAELALQRD